ncbi:MAG: tryptophan synthase beta chain [Pseudomonadota bacterium]|nr:tryptophan synthase beta chain [Pseudomonadota bacterium]
MLIKICGVTNPHIARLSAINGADYIGLLFSSVSPRQINLDTAIPVCRAARDAGAEVVGVFVDEDFDQIQNIIDVLDLKLIQLHSDKVRAVCNLFDPKLQIIYVLSQEIKMQPLPSNLDSQKDFLLFENCSPFEFNDSSIKSFRYFIAGGLGYDNVEDAISKYSPNGVDLSSRLESDLGVKDSQKVVKFIEKIRRTHGRFGQFGGRYVPELLMTPLLELENAYNTIGKTSLFRQELNNILKNYIGRPTALTEVANFAAAIYNNKSCSNISCGNTSNSSRMRILLKREDLLHTGAHKINNSLGQCLLAKKMGKSRVIAETGAGQHGVATATACAMFGLECVIYMGEVDMQRQAPNVTKMRLLGASVVSVTSGSRTLKDAVNEALRDWAETYDTTHYCLGSALGPHPFPSMVADFQYIIGEEAKQQFYSMVGTHPHAVIACVGGGSNAIGIFGAYLEGVEEAQVKLIGVEAYGHGSGLGNNAARFKEGSPGVLHGTYSYLLQTESRQVVETHSISAGLDYPAVGPQHAHLFVNGRVVYDAVTDDEALQAFLLLSKTEGIIPALESSHALGYLMSHIDDFPEDAVILVNLSGRGDKDLPSLSKELLTYV